MTASAPPVPPAAAAPGRAQPVPAGTAVSWHARTATVTVRGELDCATAPALTAQLTGILAGRPQCVVIDFSQLAFVDCSGLAPIVRARRWLPPDRPLILLAPRPAARRLLRITGIDQVCEVQSG